MNKPTLTSLETKQKGRPEGGDFFEFKAAKLLLSDNTAFNGFIPSWQSDSTVGEVVFNTGMTGYVETLTDPSYAGQILNFTYPIIGNYGVPGPETWESDSMHLRGVVVNELTHDWSHATGTRSLLEWLKAENVPVITGIDTRALTKHLRTRGTMIGVITSNLHAATNTNLNPVPITPVSPKTPKIHNPTGHKTVIAVDCGMKQNILRNLIALDLRVIQVPQDYDYTTETYDGILISNGPGDPSDYPDAVTILKRAMKADKPIFGICLGAQLMALASGATTYKLLYGHRGHNQPVITPLGRGYITSQNHGYAIDEKSLPSGWDVTFRNLNDDSVEGIAHRSKPFSAVQFHPEAAPGPTDTTWLFKDYLKTL